MKKEQKRSKIIHKIISSNILNFSKKKDGRSSPRRWICPGQTSSWWDTFCAGQRVSEEWKENFHTFQESFEKLCPELRLYIQENKTRFWDLISVEKQTSGHNIILPYRWRQEAKSAKFFWYRKIESFNSYQEIFVFTLENVFFVSA